MPNATLKTYHNANLVATYEEIFLTPNDQHIAKYDGDHALHYFPFDVTDEQIRPVLDKALEAIGMTEEEYTAVEEFGRDRTGIFTRIRERLFDLPDSPNTRFDPDLVSNYENFANIPRDQSITVGFMDVEGSRFRYGITDEQIRPIYDKALEAIGMSEAEFNNARSLFRFTDEYGHIQTFYEARMHQMRDPRYHGGVDVLHDAALQRNESEKAEYHRAFYDPFIDKLAKGETTADEIDNYVEYWHNNNTGDSLQKFLGMTDFEYEQWGKSNDSLVLEQIAYCRKYDMDYAEYLSQRENELAEVRKKFHKIELIATYEDLLKIDPQQSIIRWIGDYHIRAFKDGITDEQIEPVFKRALYAIGMTEEEFFANTDQFRYRQAMLDRMSEHLSNIPDPTITPEEMKEYGFSDKNVLPMRRETAEDLYEKMLPIYGLKKDGSMFLIKNHYGLNSHAMDGGIFGINAVTWKTWSEQVGSQPAMNDQSLNNPANSFTMKME